MYVHLCVFSFMQGYNVCSMHWACGNSLIKLKMQSVLQYMHRFVVFCYYLDVFFLVVSSLRWQREIRIMIAVVGECFLFIFVFWFYCENPSRQTGVVMTGSRLAFVLFMLTLWSEHANLNAYIRIVL